MANKRKYGKTVRNTIKRMYAVGRTKGEQAGDGSRHNSKGKYTLKQIAEKTGATIASVYAIATGER